MARICSECNQEKDESCFSLVGGIHKYLRTNCIVCRNTSTKLKKQIKDKQLKDIIAGYGCCVCGIKRHEVLEVHHLHGSYKRWGRSQSNTANVQDIKNGVAVVLCANDHSLFHSHFGGKNAQFPPQTKESTVDICLFERAKGGL